MGAQGTAVLSCARISSSISAPARLCPRRAWLAAARSSAASAGSRSSADSCARAQTVTALHAQRKRAGIQCCQLVCYNWFLSHQPSHLSLRDAWSISCSDTQGAFDVGAKASNSTTMPFRTHPGLHSGGNA